MRVLEVIQTLNEEKIEFYITGSYAVDFYTGLRNPSDIDLVIKKKDIPKIEKVFKRKFKMKVCKDGTINTCMNIGDYIDICCFDDFLKKGRHISFEFKPKVYKRCQRVYWDKNVISVIPLEELIAFKLFLNRNKNGKHDRNDVYKLLKLKKVNLFALFNVAIKRQVLFKVLRLCLLAKISSLRTQQMVYKHNKRVNKAYRASFYNVSLD